MGDTRFSSVESAFYGQSGMPQITTKIPYIVVDAFPKLGLLAALRFLEWVSQNPEGTISLPTGKTPEYFIKWVRHLLNRWNDRAVSALRDTNGLSVSRKPDMAGLRFVQIDEFYPIPPQQHNSFYYYVNEFYFRNFGLDPARALCINCDAIPLAQGKPFTDIFPDNTVDLSLRFRECRTNREALQRESIFMIDEWCARYEYAIRERGGIGFFMGGIGPDGHIAFNVRGSSHFSTTRLTATNFETQAVAAQDLGGMEIARNRLVITIGLETITYNPDAVALILASGESKATVVRQALENGPSNLYPATALQRLPGSRFYLTRGAASGLTDSVNRFYAAGAWTAEKTERAVIDCCKKINKYAHHLTLEDLRQDPYCRLIPDLGDATVPSVIDAVKKKIDKGLEVPERHTILHTGPHHDDIMLGLLPVISHELRRPANDVHFAILTSGFTAVTNAFLRENLEATKRFLSTGAVQMVFYPDFFQTGYAMKWNKDVYYYLNKVASVEPLDRTRGLCHRIVRALVTIYKVQNLDELFPTIDRILSVLHTSHDGEKNPPDIQRLKGMIREFEEELMWAHFGVWLHNVQHLRLGFYTGDIFTPQPEIKRDVMPILDLFKKVQPTILSLALDPEGSGPDTHYKGLQAIAEALRLWGKEQDLSALKIWGYRNVWYRFHPAEAEVIVPISLNSIAVTNFAFNNCYGSQVRASFPSFEYDGPFPELMQRIWAEQLKDIQLVLGKDFFYRNRIPRLRVAHGILYFREMSVERFLEQARNLEKSMEGT